MTLPASTTNDRDQPAQRASSGSAQPLHAQSSSDLGAPTSAPGSATATATPASTTAAATTTPLPPALPSNAIEAAGDGPLAERASGAPSRRHVEIHEPGHHSRADRTASPSPSSSSSSTAASVNDPPPPKRPGQLGPESLSASFLSQIQKQGHETPTVRYSFDDHHDYPHRIKWADDDDDHADHDNGGNDDFDAMNGVKRTDSYLGRRATRHQRSNSNASADRPHRPSLAQPTLQHGSRITNGSRTGRLRSNSHNDANLAWSQSRETFLFSNAAPGTALPHPSASMAGPTDDAASDRGVGAGQRTAYPWDSPRPTSSSSLAAEPEVREAKKAAPEQPRIDEERDSDASREQPATSTSAAPQADTPSSKGPGGNDGDGGGGGDDDDDDEEQTPSTWQRIKMTSNYLSLYRYADRTDYMLLAVGIVAAIGSGVPLPLIGILFGQLIDSFNASSCATQGASGGGGSAGDFTSSVNDKVKLVAIIAAVNFVLIWTYTTCWSNLGERLVRKMRERYLSSVLRQDMAFFDTMKPGEVGTRLSADLLTIQNGTSEKVGIMISSLSYFVTSYIVAFIKLPVLAGQLVSLLPAFAIISIIGSKLVAKAQKNTSTHLSHAASLASEALNNLSVVQAFGSQKRLSNIYQSHLELARKQGTRKALCAALVLGCLFFVGYSANALAFFSGSRLIASSGDGGTVGAVYTVIFLLLDASFIIGQIAPYLQTFSSASGAGQALLKTIETKSPIDGTDEKQGLVPQPGDFASIAVQFDGVDFVYPARPDSKALDGLHLDVPAGQRVGIVGMSGSGKSTIASLAQRFYDPTAGSVRINGIDIRDINVRWLRSQIGVVGQEPVLFDCTIMQSIAHGLVGSPAHDHLRETVLAFSQVGQDDEGTEMDDVMTPEQIELLPQVKDLCIEAARNAGAHDFISQLPQGYDTPVGEAGSKLSGGQKQRISIARAIVKQPKLLILDEATAALDSHSERTVGAALDRVSEGRTTIAIAHRLATIRAYDKIVVVGAGKVLEQGTHKELLARRGYYFKLAEAQDTNTSSTPASSSDDASSAGVEDIDEEGEASEDDDGGRAGKGARKGADKPTGAANSSRDNTDASAADDDDDDAQARYPASTTLRRVGGLVRREWLFILAGLLTSTIMGGSYSGEAVLFGHVINALNPCNGADEVRAKGEEFARFFFILALIQLFAYSLNGLMWGTVAERLLFRIRRMSFETMVSQRLAWYDRQSQSPASMIASLSNDANNLGGLTGVVIGTMFCILVNLTAGIVVSHAIAWRIAVVILALVPIILASGYMRLKVLADFQRRHETAYVKSNAMAIEAVGCIRTVASLGREEDVRRKFHRSLVRPYNESLRHFLFGNVFLAIALSISYFIYAFAYWWGSQNVAEGRYSQTAFFIVLPALLFSAQASGQLLAFAPDFSKAHVSTANILRVMDRAPTARRGDGGKKAGGSDGGEGDEKRGARGFGRLLRRNAHAAGHTADDPEKALRRSSDADDATPSQRGPATIDFDDVWFTYPSRSEPALRGVSLSIPSGAFAAFVGQSGSGKTTAMSLIENFYDPSHGAVRVDGRRTDAVSEHVLRRDVALVPQEPVIFYGTVRFNIALGVKPELADEQQQHGRGGGGGRADDMLEPYRPDTSWRDSVPDADIIAACKAAGIHDTIASFKQGYDTLISSSQLSGGQKQRIAIARALIRKPRLLLLDESTSALDAESEQAFQTTLDDISRSGTCTIVAIAHRMRTIRDATHVFCFQDGSVVASGSYTQLLRTSATFRAMVSYQSLK
ncbi:related to multidrug resistance protein 4 [Pseudozyma flocculosa]|uniref:Related to multidrug resistance protein 4 n=1 Tax=Pseudozyma flocculosa TaxID=84751 RepID=A0A5C3F1D1_9BASI|nr:related to multidrug resistance protein 4 [Pseudozyma flocculosa]